MSTISKTTSRRASKASKLDNEEAELVAKLAQVRLRKSTQHSDDDADASDATSLRSRPSGSRRSKAALAADTALPDVCPKYIVRAAQLAAKSPHKFNNSTIESPAHFAKTLSNLKVDELRGVLSAMGGSYNPDFTRIQNANVFVWSIVNKAS